MSLLSGKEAFGAGVVGASGADWARFEAVRHAIDSLNASPADLGFRLERMELTDDGVFAVGRAALGAEVRNGGGMPLALLFRFEGRRIVDISAPSSSTAALEDGTNHNGYQVERGPL
jgi:hypothetical protein